MKARLDVRLAELGLVRSRSQAESYIKLGEVRVNGLTIKKPGHLVSQDDKLDIITQTQYVSRAALKLESVAEALKLNFNNKVVLDVGSSTGGFTDYALQHGADHVIAVEVGTDQLHPVLQGDRRIELYEKTDIRDVRQFDRTPDIVLADLSFISLRDILPHLATIVKPDTQLVMMVKPQFEARHYPELRHKGVIKNDKMRRDILKDFEAWAQQKFVIIDKADSAVSGAKGNQERFYLLKKL